MADDDPTLGSGGDSTPASDDPNTTSTSSSDTVSITAADYPAFYLVAQITTTDADTAADQLLTALGIDPSIVTQDPAIA